MSLAERFGLKKKKKTKKRGYETVSWCFVSFLSVSVGIGVSTVGRFFRSSGVKQKKGFTLGILTFQSVQLSFLTNWSLLIPMQTSEYHILTEKWVYWLSMWPRVRPATCTSSTKRILQEFLAILSKELITAPSQLASNMLCGKANWKKITFYYSSTESWKWAKPKYKGLFHMGHFFPCRGKHELL